MSYRRRRYPRRKRSRQTQNLQSPIEALGELIAFLMGKLGSLFGRSYKPATRLATQPARHATRGVSYPPPLPRRKSALKPLPPLPADEPLPYQRSRGLLTKGERALWFPLFKAVKGRYRLFCKVRLADVVCCPPKHPQERRWFRKIGRYHVDFVLADPQTTVPLLVIELDDRSHRVRRERDDFKDKVLQSAGVPILRIPAQQAYDPLELAEFISRLLAGGPSPV
jgi:hypothetical protein